ASVPSAETVKTDPPLNTPPRLVVPYSLPSLPMVSDDSGPPPSFTWLPKVCSTVSAGVDAACVAGTTTPANSSEAAVNLPREETALRVERPRTKFSPRIANSFSLNDVPSAWGTCIHPSAGGHLTTEGGKSHRDCRPVAAPAHRSCLLSDRVLRSGDNRY